MSTDTMPLLPSPGPTRADKLFMVFLVLVLLAVAAIGRMMYNVGLKNEISKQNTADLVQWLGQAGSQRFDSGFEPAQCAGGDANAGNTWADCLPRLLADGGPLAGLRNPFTQKTPVFVSRCEPGSAALAGVLVVEKLTPGQPGAAQAFYASPLSGDDPIDKKIQLRLSTCDHGGYAGISTEVTFLKPHPSKPQLVSLEAHRANIPSDLPMRQWLYAWLLDPKIAGNYQQSVDRWIALLIVANLLALLFEHIPAVYLPYQSWFHLFDVASVAVFSAEYLLRLYLAPEDPEFKNRGSPRLRFMRSPFGIIDLLAIAPFYLQAFVPVDLRALRFLRLLRILKLFRVLIPAWQEFKRLNQGRTFRQKIHALVYPSEFGGNLHHIFDTFIMVCVLISVIGIVIESVQSIDHVMHLEFIVLDAVMVAIFSLEYITRLYCCVEQPGFQKALSGRWRHAKSPALLVDLLAILPFFLEAFLNHLFDLRFLRVFRLIRLLKLTRYTGATATLTKVLAREWPVMSASIFIMLLMVVLTATLGYLFEHQAQPEKFENIPQSIYWAVITLASVGYGDISPITPMGRIMTIILALMGIGIFAIPAALLSSAFTDQLRIERENLRNELYEMLEDGRLSEQEIEQVQAEAKRLHLSQQDVDQLIEKVRRERELLEDVSGLPLHKIAGKSEHALEHYKSLLSQIRQLGILTDAAKFEELARSSDRLTDSELALWHKIQGDKAKEQPPG